MLITLPHCGSVSRELGETLVLGRGGSGSGDLPWWCLRSWIAEDVQTRSPRCFHCQKTEAFLPGPLGLL